MTNVAKTYGCLFCVAYIDILGIKEELKKYFGIDPFFDKKLREEFESVFGDQLEFIKCFRGNFQDYFNDQRENGEFSINFNIVSDSIIAYIPIGSDYYQKSNHSTILKKIYYLMKTVGFMFIQSLMLERCFRAGFDIGMGKIENENEIFGPALIQAYLLENKKVDFFRINIGAEIIKYLNIQKKGNRSEDGQSDQDIEECKIYANKCIKLLKTDSDGAFIDILNIEFIKDWKKAEKYRNECSFPQILLDSIAFLKREATNPAFCDKIKTRYRNLLKYFENHPEVKKLYRKL